MNDFEARAPELLKTLQVFFQVRGGAPARALSEASARLALSGHDNWNGGTDIYDFEISIPARLYAQLEPLQDEIEHPIKEQLTKLIRTEPGVWIGEVVLTPRPPSEMLPSDVDAGTEVWSSQYFRLFLSHHSSQKDGASQLKDALTPFRIAGFVAHADIEPTKEWESQIEMALRTMDALVAILGPEFVGSKWCDQEVGFAMGRGSLVVPVRAGADPHGFLGKYQGLQAKGRLAEQIASSLFRILINHQSSQRRLIEVLIQAFLSSRSWEDARHLMGLLEQAPQIDADLRGELRQRWQENEKITDSWGVPERLRKLLG